MQVIVPLVCFAIPFLAGLILVRKRIKYLVPAFAIGFAILMIWAIYKGQQAQGWDGIGYAILAILMAAPALIGTLVGAAVGLWQRKRRDAKQT